MQHDNTPKLAPAVSGERKEISGRAGKLSYYTTGEGPPLLLLHSINAAGSVAEMAPIYEHMAQTHCVYAPDLPGFGFSDRSDRAYTVRLYTDAVFDMLDEIGGASPVHAAALSLASEFLARAAAQRPERFCSIALITPTGFRAGSERLRLPAGSTRYMPLLDKILTFSLWKKPLFRALTSPRSIRYFLRRTWGSRNIDEKLASYCDDTTHQPGAEHAPYAFLSGALFSTDMRTVYESLTMPVWVPHGTRGDFSDFSGADWTGKLDNWNLQAFESGALPHFECPDRFFSGFSKFVERAEAAQSSNIDGRQR